VKGQSRERCRGGAGRGVPCGRHCGLRRPLPAGKRHVRAGPGASRPPRAPRAPGGRIMSPAGKEMSHHSPGPRRVRRRGHRNPGQWREVRGMRTWLQLPGPSAPPGRDPAREGGRALGTQGAAGPRPRPRAGRPEEDAGPGQPRTSRPSFRQPVTFPKP
jgi:hypothetical protein